MAETSLVNAWGKSPVIEALPALAVSEIVLQTSQFARMQAWYEAVLGAVPSYEYTAPDPAAVDLDNRVLGYERLCFLRIQMDFPYSQVLALFQRPGLRRDREATGLHHMQFRQGAMVDLVARVEALDALGIRPAQSFNHGPSTSFYFLDPDENSVEINGPNVSSQQEYVDFFRSAAFRRSPNGVAIDARDFCRRFRAGDESVTSLPG